MGNKFGCMPEFSLISVIDSSNRNCYSVGGWGESYLISHTNVDISYNHLNSPLNCSCHCPPTPLSKTHHSLKGGREGRREHGRVPRVGYIIDYRVEGHDDTGS